jgi:hypothetical protein
MARVSGKYPDDRKLFVYKLVDHRRVLVLCLLVVSMLILPFALTVELDRTLKAAYVTSSPAYELYKELIAQYGPDEFILIAVITPKGVMDAGILKGLDAISNRLKQRPEIFHVLSVSNLKVFGKRSGVFGNFPLIESKDGVFGLRPQSDLQRIQKALPLLDFLISSDLRTAGILLQLQDEWRFHPDLGKFLGQVEQIVRDNLPEGAEFRVVGAPVIREAVQHLTIRTTIIFSCMCALVVCLITLYIFKSLRVAAITMLTIGISVYWVLGLMSLCRITLNATTSISFGLILITSVATVIHIVSHYCEVWPRYQDRELAVKRSMAVVGRACIMSSVTSAIAFGTIMISDIPMVQQLGFVMSTGVLIAFVISFVLTPTLLIWLKPMQPNVLERMKEDWFAGALRAIEKLVFSRYRLCAWCGVLFTIVMFAGAPLIRIDTQLLSLFVDSSQVRSDIRFVEKHLHPIRTLEVTVDMQERAFREPEAWKKIDVLQKRLAQIPGVASVDSVMPLIEYLHGLIAQPGTPPQEIYSNKRVLSEILSLISFSSEGKELLRRYVNPKFAGIRMTVRVGDTGASSLNQVIESIEKTATECIGSAGKTAVTGEQAVFAAQASDVVDSQVWSVILALTAITIILIWQLRSLTLGLFSLLPIIPPISVILGMMGWLGIPLDNVTVFATDIAIGLAVDDTFHYLAQMRRDIAASGPGEDRVRSILKQSFHSTARSLMSTTAPLFLGFLALALTPTKPAIFFGFLGSGSMLVALFANIIFLPSIILTFKVFSRMMEREAHRKAVAVSSP